MKNNAWKACAMLFFASLACGTASAAYADEPADGFASIPHFERSRGDGRGRPNEPSPPSTVSLEEVLRHCVENESFYSSLSACIAHWTSEDEP